MRKIFLMLFIGNMLFFKVNAQLGNFSGNYFEIGSNSGNTINHMMQKTWLYRNAQGDNWYTTSVHDGISVDVSFLTPHVDTRVWWDRNPNTGEQSWEDGSQTYFGIFGGNIGIGTKTPSDKLAVNGTIKAKEVKVTMQDWPDYVFDQDYKILGLQELEGYIKSNKHLPEMPSAKEVETNGISLGEMNKLLLKKVEELTLHLINQGKEIEALKATLNKP